MIIVSDTSPLNYLILIGEENILPTLFGRIIIPNVVFDELQAVGASEKDVEDMIRDVRRFMEDYFS